MLTFTTFSASLNVLGDGEHNSIDIDFTKPPFNIGVSGNAPVAATNGGEQGFSVTLLSDHVVRITFDSTPAVGSEPAAIFQLWFPGV